MVAVENHMHALEREPLGIALEGENALAAQNVRTLLLDQSLHPGKELVRIEGLVDPERERLHLFVVIVLETARMMMVIMLVPVMVAVIMLMIVAAGLEKLGLDLQDAIEIEGVSPQNLLQRKCAALGLVHPGIGIDRADATFDLVELGCGDEVGLVDDDHVREG